MVLVKVCAQNLGLIVHLWLGDHRILVHRIFQRLTSALLAQLTFEQLPFLGDPWSIFSALRQTGIQILVRFEMEKTSGMVLQEMNH